ncbi:hypothetical protein, partial [Nocardioides sp. NPDC000441]|uniref:hypothetical protein n=1 Tax=Nocardioides sp. NPDC000441 TaxID=3154256 RepID=UPI0033327C8C
MKWRVISAGATALSRKRASAPVPTSASFAPAESGFFSSLTATSAGAAHRLDHRPLPPPHPRDPED